MQSCIMSGELVAGADQVLANDIRALFSEKLSLRVESPHANLFESGMLDSITLVQLILYLEERFDVPLPMQELDCESLSSIASIASLISGRKQAGAARANVVWASKAR